MTGKFAKDDGQMDEFDEKDETLDSQNTMYPEKSKQYCGKEEYFTDKGCVTCQT
jgi:hypothetical protein